MELESGGDVELEHLDNGNDKQWYNKRLKRNAEAGRKICS